MSSDLTDNNLREALIISSSLPKIESIDLFSFSKISFYNNKNSKVALVYIMLSVIISISFLTSLLVSFNDNLQIILKENIEIFVLSTIVLMICIVLPYLSDSLLYNNYFSYSCLSIFTISHIIVINYINLYFENNYVVMILILVFISISVLLYKLYREKFDIGIYLRDVTYYNIVFSIFYCILYPIIFSLICSFSIIIFSLYLIIQTKIRMFIYNSKQESLASRILKIYSDVVYIPKISILYLINRHSQN